MGEKTRESGINNYDFLARYFSGSISVNVDRYMLWADLARSVFTVIQIT